ncbi:unnamed protein product [Amoebophrya sp. A120]|nr:unnamed protein product [Amoebophrya sp. A120]|eukprot:GSA120T00025768001.1
MRPGGEALLHWWDENGCYAGEEEFRADRKTHPREVVSLDTAVTKEHAARVYAKLEEVYAALQKEAVDREDGLAPFVTELLEDLSRGVPQEKIAAEGGLHFATVPRYSEIGDDVRRPREQKLGDDDHHKVATELRVSTLLDAADGRQQHAGDEALDIEQASSSSSTFGRANGGRTSTSRGTVSLSLDLGGSGLKAMFVRVSTKRTTSTEEPREPRTEEPSSVIRQGEPGVFTTVMQLDPELKPKFEFPELRLSLTPSEHRLGYVTDIRGEPPTEWFMRRLRQEYGAAIYSTFPPGPSRRTTAGPPRQELPTTGMSSAPPGSPLRPDGTALLRFGLAPADVVPVDLANLTSSAIHISASSGDSYKLLGPTEQKASKRLMEAVLMGSGSSSGGAGQQEHFYRERKKSRACPGKREVEIQLSESDKAVWGQYCHSFVICEEERRNKTGATSATSSRQQLYAEEFSQHRSGGGAPPHKDELQLLHGRCHEWKTLSQIFTGVRVSARTDSEVHQTAAGTLLRDLEEMRHPSSRPDWRSIDVSNYVNVAAGTHLAVTFVSAGADGKPAPMGYLDMVKGLVHKKARGLHQKYLSDLLVPLPARIMNENSKKQVYRLEGMRWLNDPSIDYSKPLSAAAKRQLDENEDQRAFLPAGVLLGGHGQADNQIEPYVSAFAWTKFLREQLAPLAKQWFNIEHQSTSSAARKEGTKGQEEETLSGITGRSSGTRRSAENEAEGEDPRDGSTSHPQKRWVQPDEQEQVLGTSHPENITSTQGQEEEVRRTARASSKSPLIPLVLTGGQASAILRAAGPKSNHGDETLRYLREKFGIVVLAGYDSYVHCGTKQMENWTSRSPGSLQQQHDGLFQNNTALAVETTKRSCRGFAPEEIRRRAEQYMHSKGEEQDDESPGRSPRKNKTTTRNNGPAALYNSSGRPMSRRSSNTLSLDVSGHDGNTRSEPDVEQEAKITSSPRPEDEDVVSNISSIDSTSFSPFYSPPSRRPRDAILTVHDENTGYNSERRVTVVNETASSTGPRSTCLEQPCGHGNNSESRRPAADLPQYGADGALALGSD